MRHMAQLHDLQHEIFDIYIYIYKYIYIYIYMLFTWSKRLRPHLNLHLISQLGCHFFYWISTLTQGNHTRI